MLYDEILNLLYTFTLINDSPVMVLNQFFVIISFYVVSIYVKWKIIEIPKFFDSIQMNQKENL